MTSPQALMVDNTIAGTWRLHTRPSKGLPTQDVTYFRDIPTTIGAFSWEDPYGPKTMSLTFPKVTIFDRVGFGELEWLEAFADFDLVYTGALPAGYPYTSFRWEGYAVSFDFGDNGLTVQLVGAMYQMDNYLAKPEYYSRPMPYEYAIRRQFAGKPDLRVRAPIVEWPSWWTTKYTGYDVVTGEALAKNMVPVAVTVGGLYTGLLTRETGSWDETLTGYIQSLLASMYTARGRWTLDLLPGREARLRHIDNRTDPGANMLVINPMSPGVQITLSEDWSQSLSVAYGQGTTRTGSTFTGMQVSADGSTTTYEPLAALRQVHPQTATNPWLDTTRMRKEVKLQVQEGLELDEMRSVGNAHLKAFSEPGCTGTIELSSDPLWNGVSISHTLIRPGMAAQIPNIFGTPEGIVVHITAVSVDLAGGRTSLTVDSKYRDALTVDEVRLRGRDSLSVQRQLIGGKYQPAIQDQLMPWSYSEGSGLIPSGPTYNATKMMKGIPDSVLFPWTEWTRAHPPGKADWRHAYIHIGPKSSNATENWANSSDSSGGSRLGFPIRLGQAGTIRLIEIAAYDQYGNVLRVPFHFSLYTSPGVNALAMPTMALADEAGNPPYKAGQKYPFFKGAWEQYRTDGTKIDTEQPVSVSSAGLIQAYGTGIVKAGYWPGSSVTGDPATGLLRDEGTFSWDTTQDPAAVNPYTGRLGAKAGYIYAMIYCDAQLTRDVYFLGRMYRVEPGNGG